MNHIKLSTSGTVSRRLSMRRVSYHYQIVGIRKNSQMSKRTVWSSRGDIGFKEMSVIYAPLSNIVRRAKHGELVI